MAFMGVGEMPSAAAPPEGVELRSAVLFDLFGALVTYDAGRTVQDYGGSHEILRRHGLDLSYGEFVTTWDALFTTFEEASAPSLDEFSMYDLFEAYVSTRVPKARPKSAEFVETYLAEWSRPVRLIEGVEEMLDTLRARGHRTGVVSNTHHAALVSDVLRRFGILDPFDAVITSVEHGKKKPHPSIYRSALAAIGAMPGDAVFVGDSHVPDYEGPRALGIRAYLVGPPSAGVPLEHHLGHVTEIVTVLDAASGDGSEDLAET